MKRFAIIGSGCAAYHAAKAIRERDKEAQIHIYSDNDLGPYNPMLTTYFVKGAIPYGALFPFGSREEIQSRLDLCWHPNCPAAGLDPERKAVRLGDGTEETFDGIVIATGASAVMPPIPGLDLPGVFKMRTAQDAVELKERLESGTIKSALVIGASWVGIKVVEDMVEHQVPCTLVDGAKWMFFVAAFEETARRAQKDLEAKGVQVDCEQMLDHIEALPGGGLCAVMQNGRRFEADTVAVCIGVRMNVGFLRDSGIAMNRGVLVDAHMRTNYEGIYAAGDCCEAIDIQSGAPRNIGVWANAGRQGDVAGANLAGVPMEFDANILANLAHYLDYDFISIGDVSACKETDQVYGYEDERYYIRAVRSPEAIKCINMIGSADSNGIVRNIFIKSIKEPKAGLDVPAVCQLQRNGFPDSFIEFLGGISID